MSTVSASSPYVVMREVRGSICKAHREFSGTPTDVTRKAARVCKRMLMQSSCVDSDAITRRAVLLDDLENLMIRCSLADARRPPSLNLKPQGTLLVSTNPDAVKRDTRQPGLFAKLEPRFSFSQPFSVWLPFSEDELASYRMKTSTPFIERKVFSYLQPSADHETIYRQRNDALVEKADVFFLQVGGFPEVDCTFSEEALASDPRLIEELLLKKNFDGVFVGEGHGQTSPIRFLIDNLENFKKAGVTTLFTEYFTHDTMQRHLDAYMSSPSDEMHPVLKAVVETFDKFRDRKYNVANLLKKAKALGIRIVAADTSDANAPGDKNTKMGIKAMNYAAYQIIERERGAGKFVAWIGQNYGTTVQVAGSTIPGLADLFQCPFLIFQDSDSGKPVETGIRSCQLDADVVGRIIHLIKRTKVKR